MENKIFKELYLIKEIINNIDNGINDLSKYADDYPFIEKNLNQVKALINLIKQESVW